MSLLPSSPLSALPPSSDNNLGEYEEYFGELGPLPALFPFENDHVPTVIPASDDTSFRGSSPVIGTHEQKKAIRRSKKVRRLQEDQSEAGQS